MDPLAMDTDLLIIMEAIANTLIPIIMIIHTDLLAHKIMALLSGVVVVDLSNQIDKALQAMYDLTFRISAGHLKRVLEAVLLQVKDCLLLENKEQTVDLRWKT